MVGDRALSVVDDDTSVHIQIPIILITAYPDERSRRLALRAGESLDKPFSEALPTAIDLASKAGDNRTSLSLDG
jgi:CheY-like chemotaxis protein